MKSIYRIFFVSLFLLSTTSQVFAMGSKRPAIEDIVTSASSGNSSPELSLPSLPISLPTTSSENIYLGLIESLALNSACSQVSFANLGTVPLAFINGLTQTYAQSLCKEKKKSFFSSLTRLTSLFSLNNILKNALAIFQSRFRGFPITSNQFTSAPACNQLLGEVRDLIDNDEYACDDLIK